MNRRGSALVLLLGGLALIFAALAGYFYFQTRQDSGNTQVETGSDRNEQVDEMANWKTYENTDFGFSFQYPSHLQVVDNSTVTKSGTLMVGFQNHPFGVSIEKINETITQNYSNMPKVSQKQIDGILWDILHVEATGPLSGGRQSGYQTINNGNRYFIRYTEQTLIEIDQILSTFKFLP